jgi:hypothetical protein
MKITDHQIQLLQDEADQHGDKETSAFCEIALWGKIDPDFTSADIFAEYKKMGEEEARELCEEMIGYNHREAEYSNGDWE